MADGDLDKTLPFLIEHSSLRGRLVRLGPALDEILTTPDYPPPATELWGSWWFWPPCCPAR